jgi:hypothetical protein
MIRPSRLQVHAVTLPRTYRLAAPKNCMPASTYTPMRKPKKEGTIATVFSSLSGGVTALPPRFADLKKEIWRDTLVQSWREVLDELCVAVEEVAERGVDVLKLAFTYTTFY